MMVWSADPMQGYLTEQGIEGFWNDMNEPAIFYSKEGLAELKDMLKDFLENENGGGITAGEMAADNRNQGEDSEKTAAEDDKKTFLPARLYGR